ncbi:subunit beta of clathrin/coatomer adaptor AP-3 complex [Chloropicon primus]|uniref:Subunit beta of clathrin/coatomer adaptor AP-3 complex n=2 Tax=Chloropicon primus TaxID=1764295 RepID=A0A5B8MV98_9CHLO|nr:subunit beta of clathrin/coatomer adaptor AP-3 complex [Chloropicon primus]UPR02887.1 subunit beta of clathrin/coatomer adaptor AP-3 complex [Chloropicon primus]|eukprot:QDZ23674.1 subunit beta of clathrin/coatomer adaptor AP-3 complex [Chloropicon primus]
MKGLKDFGRGLKEKMRNRASSTSNSAASTPSASPSVAQNNGVSYNNNGFGSAAASIGFGSDPASATEERQRKQQLSSKSTHEQLEAMRWLITETGGKKAYTNMSQQISVSSTAGAAGGAEDTSIADTFLPSVVKLLATKHPEIKRLVYIFLVRHAESKPDDTLMAVNEIQKGLNDSNNAQARVLSVRVLSSIRVQDIVPITFVVIKSAVFDPNALVRKAAVVGLAKLYSFNRDMEEDLFEILLKVFDSEPSPLVMGSACEVFNTMCPERLDAVHWSYRKLCKMLVDMDEWSQVAALNLLHRYARANFVDPNKGKTQGTKQVSMESSPKVESVDNFYGDDDSSSKIVEDSEVSSRPENLITEDHRLLLRCTWPLLQSRNSAVVMATVALQFDFAPSYEHHRCGKALMFCMRSTRSASEYVILHSVASFAHKYPEVFAPHFTGFFVRASDPLHVKCLKLNVLTEIIAEDNIPELLKELQAYLRDNEMTFVSNAIFALGRCVQKYPKMQERILKSLMVLSTHASEQVSANSVQVILGIAQGRPDLYMEQIAKLIKRYHLMASPKSKMGVLWLSSCHLTLQSRAGEGEQDVKEMMGKETFAKLSDLAYEAARLATTEFIEQDEEVKIQILNSLARLTIHGVEKAKPAFDYVLNMAKCDTSYSVRDKARLYGGLTSGGGADGESISKKIILASANLKPISSPIDDSKNAFSIGSLSHLVDHSAPGYQTMPEFRTTPTNSTLRDAKITQNSSKSQNQNQVRSQYPNNAASSSQQPHAAADNSPLDNFYSDSESDGYSGSYSYSYSESEEEEEERGQDEEQTGEGAEGEQ